MLALECIGFSSANLQIEECRQVGDFLLDSGQSHHSVELGKTIGIIDSLGSLIGDVGNIYGHHLLIRQRSQITLLQTLCLLRADFVKQLTHGTSIGKILVTRVVKLCYHLERQLLCFRSKYIFLLLSKYLHDSK